MSLYVHIRTHVHIHTYNITNCEPYKYPYIPIQIHKQILTQSDTYVHIRTVYVGAGMCMYAYVRRTLAYYIPHQTKHTNSHIHSHTHRLDHAYLITRSFLNTRVQMRWNIYCTIVQSKKGCK